MALAIAAGIHLVYRVVGRPDTVAGLQSFRVLVLAYCVFFLSKQQSKQHIQDHTSIHGQPPPKQHSLRIQSNQHSKSLPDKLNHIQF